MPSKKHKPEEIIGKLREVEIVLAQAPTEDIMALAKQYGRYGPQAREDDPSLADAVHLRCCGFRTTQLS